MIRKLRKFCQIILFLGCDTTMTAIHELMHALGVSHEHKRPDRDQYINVYLQNVESGKEHNYKKESIKEFWMPRKYFDFRSIMLYEQNSFSKNRRNTWEPKNRNQPIMSRTEKERMLMSQGDIEMVNKLYNCR